MNNEYELNNSNLADTANTTQVIPPNNAGNTVNTNINPNEREQIKAARSYKLTSDEKKEEPVEQSIKQQEIKEETPVVPKNKKSKNIIARFFFLIILLLVGYIIYSNYNYNLTIIRLDATSAPVSTLEEVKQLDLNSTIVQDLYSKVRTNIREDIAESTLNNSMKLYLAYRQIPNDKFYESNCNLFNNAAMTPYTCNASTFTPMAFKVEALKIEYKKLFGETANFEAANIQIGRNCIGGYEYIASRGEYVQGSCTQNITTTYKVKKELKEATSKQSTITLKEDVKYTASEGQTLPEHLKSGTYIYIFKLDSNYNYIYKTKYLEQE